MAKENNVEFKVGLFVLIGLLALTFFIFSISDSSVFEKGKSLNVIFSFANGLKKSAPVRVAGVDQGIVRNIKLFFDREDSKTKAIVELWLKKDAVIPFDSTVLINQLGLLGEKYIEIIPGEDTRNFLAEGQTIVGKTPIMQEVISDRVMEITAKLDKTIAGANRIIADENNAASIKTALANLSDLSGNMKDITGNVREGKGTVGHLFYDEGLYDDLHTLTSDLKQNPWKLLYRPK